MARYDAFLSYAGPDSELARWLRVRLEEAGLRVFHDELDLVPGQAVADALSKGIGDSTYFLPLVTPIFRDRQWTPWEVESALAFQPMGKVIPILRGTTRDELPGPLRPFKALELAIEDGEAGDPVEVLAALLKGEDVPALRRRLRDERPEPLYPDARVRELSERLRELYRRRKELRRAEQSTDVVQQEILQLKREIRAGRQPRAGDSLGDGRFELVQELGQGGFGIVWKAFDEQTERIVAIKILQGRHTEDRSMRERFFRGARAMAQLRHPGIAEVIEPHGADDDGQCWFAMEFLAGGDLRAAVTSGAIRGASGLRALLPVADALAYAHASDMVHRDVKPENILLDRAGGTRLTDFDLVLAQNTTGGTVTGAGLGTFLFAAPEQLHDAAHVGRAADVYGLGMTALFVLAGGELPPEVVRQPARVLDGLWCSASIRRVVERAIRWSAADRWESVEQFAAALAQAIEADEPAEVVAPAEAPPVLVRVRDLNLDLGAKARSLHVLRDLSFALRRGELVAVVGAAGSGRGALLAVLAGVLQPTSGTVLVDGEPPQRARIGLASERGLLPELSIAEHIRCQLSIYDGGCDVLVREEAVRKVLERVDMQPLGERCPPELTRTLCHRASVALELAREPDLLLLENISPRDGGRFVASIVQACRAWAGRERTVVMEVRALSDRDFELFDRVLVLEHGQLAWSGPPYQAVSFFERVSRQPAPMTSTSMDFLQEMSPMASGSFRDGREFQEQVIELLDEASTGAEAPSAPPPRPRYGALVSRHVLQLRRQLAKQRRRLLEAPALAIAVGLLPLAPAEEEWGLRLHLLCVLAFWFGVSYMGELAQERELLRREGVAGLRPGLHLASKLPGLAALALGQLAFAVAVVALVAGIPRAPWSILGILACTTLAATTHGLLLGALVHRPRPGGGAEYIGALLAIQMAFAGVLFSVGHFAGDATLSSRLLDLASLPVVCSWSATAVSRLQEAGPGLEVLGCGAAILGLGALSFAAAAAVLGRRLRW